MTQPVLVWCEIPVTDLSRAMAFYGTILGAELKEDNTGPNPMAMLPSTDANGSAGHLYPGKPAPVGTGNTVHLGLTCSLEEGMERVKTAGGKVLSPPIEIPSGRFAYCLDLDGNSLGIFAA